MTFEQQFPCLRVFGVIFCTFSYIASFASKEWVVDDTKQWGLWEWCYANHTKTARCHGISPGDSPGYYEGVRTMACFTLVVFVGLLGTCNEREGLGKTKWPAVVAFVGALFATITLTVLGVNYDEDDRWKDQGCSLGWCYWLVLADAIILSILGCMFFKYDSIKKAQGAVRTAPSIQPVQRRASNASSVSITSRKKITIFRRTLFDARNRIEVAASQTPGPPSAPPQRPDERERTSGAEFPVLTLPRYEIPAEPGTTMPEVPPPSYDDVMRGGATPPPVVLVRGSNLSSQQSNV